MKTVLSLDEDAADLLRAHAEKRGVSLSELIRKGARQTVTVKPGFVVRKKGQLRSPE